MGGVEEAAHLLGRLALDAHGDAEGADLEVGHAAIEDLAEEVRPPVRARAGGRPACRGRFP
jgi:hypothetical protein